MGVLIEDFTQFVSDSRQWIEGWISHDAGSFEWMGGFYEEIGLGNIRRNWTHDMWGLQGKASHKSLVTVYLYGN